MAGGTSAASAERHRRTSAGAKSVAIIDLTRRCALLSCNDAHVSDMQMAETIELKCQHCKRSMRYPRTADPNIPANVVRIVQGHCDQCWHGDHDSETWYDARGLEVCQSSFGQ